MLTPTKQLMNLRLNITTLKKVMVLEKRLIRLQNLVEMQLDRDGGRKQDSSISQWRSEQIIVLNELLGIAVDTAARMQHK